MTLLNPAPDRQLSLHWDTEPRALAHHLAEWTTGSAVATGIAEQAIESIKGTHQVLGFLNPAKLGRNLGYATRPVQRAREHYARPCRGGWLASGHAPLEDGGMVPVTFKPDYARIGNDRKPIKYERPAGSRPVPYLPPLDATSYEAIAARAGLTPPPFESSWSAWLWLLAQPAVDLCIDEGEKKSAAACSHGWLTIGLAGIWNGCPKPKDAAGVVFGAPTLIAELQWLASIRPKGAPLIIAFDASESARGRVAIRQARRRLGHLLLDAGHQVRIREMVQPQGAVDFVKGTDDLLVHGGAPALAALPVLPFKQWLEDTSKQAITDHLLQPFKTSGRQHRIIARHFKASDVPSSAALVALIGGFGTNKTGALAERPSTSRMVSITHRRSLADNQGHRFGLAVKREGQVLHAFDQSQAHLRQVESLLAEHEGFVVVVDSSYIGGSSELKPDQCRGAVLFIDEADAFLRHCLTAATHIAKHRTSAVANLAACVAAADQVVLAGAHIDETTLAAFEVMRGDGTKAHIIESTLQTAAGRELVMYRKVEDLLQQTRNLCNRRAPFVFHTGSKKTSSKMAPVNLARLVRRWWPDARILEMTAETIREPDHPAAAAIEDPQKLLAFDVVLSSPVLETGFSIEDHAGHFQAVLGHTSGHVMPHAFVQSLGRLRSSVPRYVYCRSTGTKVGNGAPVVDELETGKLELASQLVRLHLVDAAAACPDAARYLRWWSQLAADQNWLAPHYRHAVAELLGREGYAVQRLDLVGSEAGTELVDLLDEDRTETIAEETAAVAAAPAPTADQLELLEQRQRLTADQRRQLERGRIERDLGLPTPTAKQVEASRNDGYGKIMQHLLVVDSDARKQWQQQKGESLSPSQRHFAPDTTKAMAPATRATALQQMPWLLELVNLAGTGQTRIMADYEAAHAFAKSDGNRWREVFGFNPTSGKQARTYVASMLALLGFKLKRTSRREREHDGERMFWHYEVLDELAAIDRQQVMATMRQALQ
jgi:hypothetical protein